MSNNVDRLVLEIQNGSDKKEELYIEIKGLLYHIAKRYWAYARRRGHELDDLVAVSWFGVEKAIKTFQPDRGAKFSFYAVYFIRRALAAYLGFRKYQPFPLSLDEPVPGTEGLSYGDTVEDPESSARFEAVEDLAAYSQTVTAALGELNEKERAVIHAFFMQNKTLRQIAAENGFSESYAHQVRNHALRKLRRNKNIRELYTEEWQACERHVTLSEYRRTWTSATEKAALHLVKNERP